MATRQMLLDRAFEVDGGFWSKTRSYMRRLRDDQNTICRPVAVPVQYEVIIRSSERNLLTETAWQSTEPAELLKDSEMDVIDLVY